jgi:hypothetical protein
MLGLTHPRSSINSIGVDIVFRYSFKSMFV